MKIIFACLLLVTALARYASPGEVIEDDEDLPPECVRVLGRPKYTSRYWKNTFNLTRGKDEDSFRGLVSLSNVKLAGTDQYYYAHHYMIFEVGIRFPFRRMRSNTLLHWYHGNTVALFIIKGSTGALTYIELGIARQRFVTLLNKGDFVTGFIRNPKPGRYALLGLTTLPAPNTPIEIMEREVFQKMFPIHADLIRKHTSPDDEDDS